MKRILSVISILVVSHCFPSPAADWKKHVIMESGRNSTAVAADFTGDGKIDVITSYAGKVSRFAAPDWKETVLYRFDSPGGACIHSETLDVDDDGDADWAGSLAKGGPFWLENPGNADGKWIARLIDPDIRGIHCVLKADVDRDGKDDLIINNFEPKGILADSIAWFKIPDDPKTAKQWERHVFADKTARGGSHYFGFGDIDGDGWGEIAAGAKGKPFKDGNWFSFWKNPGKEKLKGPWKKVILAENQLAATCIKPADVNGDGKMDFIATRGHSQGVIWLEGPDWKIHDIHPEIQSPHSLTVKDFDQDGDMDAASCGYDSKWVMLYKNDGKGNFTLQKLDNDQESYDLRSVDMDQDGDLDLLNAGRASGNVAWYENPLK